MKNLLPPFLSALFAACLTAFLVTLLREPRPDAARVVAVPAPSPRPALAAPARDPAPAPAELVAPVQGAVLARLAALEQRLAALESKNAIRRAVDGRPTKSDALGSEGGPARTFVLDVLEEDRRLRDEARATERREMLVSRLQDRVARTAEELGLSSQDEATVFSVLQEEIDRRNELFESMRQGSFDPSSRDLIREEMSRLQDWKMEELSRQLGPALAQQVLEFETGRRGGFARDLFRGARGDRGGTRE